MVSSVANQLMLPAKIFKEHNASVEAKTGDEAKDKAERVRDRKGQRYDGGERGYIEAQGVRKERRPD